MWRTDAIIIGGGQAGLAMSHCLGRLGIDHVVLERGRIGERWHTERWDSLRLLTPNWMTRFPGWSWQGTDPDGFMTKHEYIACLEQYGGAAPVISGTTVRSVRDTMSGYRVETDRGVWNARCVVIATGHCDVPLIPEMARDLPASISQLAPRDYRNPTELPRGGVLIVGASASGVQLAEEIQRCGRDVVISVGRHTRLPRVYRGHDIMWWLTRPSIVGQSNEPVADASSVHAQPSMQLVGRPDRSAIDLGTLRDLGVRVVGRLAGIRDGAAYLNDDLEAKVAAAQTRVERLLARIDGSVDVAGTQPEAWPAPLAFQPSPAALDLEASGIRTVIWATGFKRDYSWLRVPVIDAAGEIVHRGGITPAPGLYVTGLRFLRRWNPAFIDAVSADASELAAEIQRYFHETSRAAA